MNAAVIYPSFLMLPLVRSMHHNQIQLHKAKLKQPQINVSSISFKYWYWAVYF